MTPVQPYRIPVGSYRKPVVANDDGPVIGLRKLGVWLLFGIIGYALLGVVGVTLWQAGKALAPYIGL